MTQEQYISLYYTVGNGSLRLIYAYRPPYNKFEDEGSLWLPDATTDRARIMGGKVTGIISDWSFENKSGGIALVVDTADFSDGSSLTGDDFGSSLMILRTIEELTEDEKQKAISLAEDGELDWWNCVLFPDLNPEEKLLPALLFADVRDYLRSVGVDCDNLIQKGYAVSERIAKERGWIQ